MKLSQTVVAVLGLLVAAYFSFDAFIAFYAMRNTLMAVALGVLLVFQLCLVLSLTVGAFRFRKQHRQLAA